MLLTYGLSCLLTAPGPDDAGMWSSWCPEVDIMTCGVNAENAVAMLEEAVSMAAAESLQNFYCVNFETYAKEVCHPLRYVETAKECEDWDLYQKIQKSISVANDMISIPEEVKPDTKNIIVFGYMKISTKAGVIKVDCDFAPIGFESVS